MTKRNFVTLLLLALLFITPGVAALLYFQHPQWLEAASTNKGRLLNPPYFLEELALGKKKWHFIIWYPQSCDTACLQTVDKLARIRLALGRRLYEVEQWLLLKENEDTEALKKELQQQDIRVLSLKENEQKYAEFDNKPEIFIANPDGYLVLAYDEAANPKDIYQDIKHLLSANGK